MAIIGLFQCDPWCLPTQKLLKNATNDISIQEFHNVTRHVVKDTDIETDFRAIETLRLLMFGQKACGKITLKITPIL